MSTQTAPPTTRQLANRLRSTLEWIDSHADELPTGWTIKTYGYDIPVALDYHRLAGPADVFESLVSLLGEPDLGTTWAAEGDRPMITVYGVKVTAAYKAAGIEVSDQ